MPRLKSVRARAKESTGKGSRRPVVASVLGPAPGYSEAHLRVLRAAMVLMAKHGYGGASLRALAAKLRISQPSLYHYFTSKEELVEQIVRAQAARILRVPDDMPREATLDEGLRYGTARLIDNYRDSDHVTFVRFLLTIGSERPKMRALSRAILFDRGLSVLEAFVSAFVPSGEVRACDVRPLCELIVMAMVMKLFSHHALFGPPDQGFDFEAFGDFVVDTALRGARARAAQHGTESC